MTSLDWESYPILTFPDVPEIVIDLIDRPNERPWGAGEPAAAVVPSAISNAVFDATGVRLRSVPLHAGQGEGGDALGRVRRYSAAAAGDVNLPDRIASSRYLRASAASPPRVA